MIHDQGAGFRQLSRIMGISYGIIQRVVANQSPLIYRNLFNKKGSSKDLAKELKDF